SLLQKFQTTLFSMENPLARILNTLQPELVPVRGKRGVHFYFQPLIYRNRTACWEAERARSGKCIAVENYHCRLKLQLQQQVCGICDMRAYAAMAVVETKREATDTDIAELRALIEL